MHGVKTPNITKRILVLHKQKLEFVLDCKHGADLLLQ
jgi:hypothetical protein